MIFYRYQNTKTLEKHSFEYVDVNTLYDRAITYINCLHEGETDTASLKNSLFDYLKDYCFELKYRQNLSEDNFDNILREVIKIILKYYDQNASIEEQNRNRKIAWDEITLLMKPYPLKGLFVIPEYCMEFRQGTKYSASELCSNIITGLSAPSAKYLAIYEGEVICNEMEYGGTLIRPTRLIKVLDLYKEVDKVIGATRNLYRHLIYDNDELKDSIEITKELLKDYIEWNLDSLAESTIKTHTRELLLKELLVATKANYKQLQYRNFNNKHYAIICKNNLKFKFCISEEKVTADNIFEGDTIVHNGELSVTDLKTNTVDKKTFRLRLAV